MSTIVASDVAVLVRGHGWRPLFELWCGTAALITALDLLLWLEPQGVSGHAGAVLALMLAVLAPQAARAAPPTSATPPTAIVRKS